MMGATRFSAYRVVVAGVLRFKPSRCSKLIGSRNRMPPLQEVAQKKVAISIGGPKHGPQNITNLANEFNNKNVWHPLHPDRATQDRGTLKNPRDLR